MADSIDTTIASRRSLLRGLAVAPAAAGTGMTLSSIPAAPAAPVHPDAGLLAIHREWQAAAAHEDRCVREAVEAEARLVRPPLPDALRVREGEPPAVATLAYEDGQRIDWYPPKATAQMRRHVNNPAAAKGTPTQIRMAEIVAAADAHEAALARAREACGHTAACRASNRAYEAEKALRRALTAMPAKTLAGVQAKVDAATWLYEGDDYLESDLAEKLQAEHMGQEALQVSILRDLARLREG